MQPLQHRTLSQESKRPSSLKEMATAGRGRRHTHSGKRSGHCLRLQCKREAKRTACHSGFNSLMRRFRESTASPGEASAPFATWARASAQNVCSGLEELLLGLASSLLTHRDVVARHLFELLLLVPPSPARPLRRTVVVASAATRCIRTLGAKVGAACTRWASWPAARQATI